MSIILVGLNHRTAPIELREKLALDGFALQTAHNTLAVHTKTREGAILSTCNRLEVYAVVENRDSGWAHLASFIAGLQDMPSDTLQPHLYQLEGAAAINHLMRVACGLDSMILGEPQILGQVKHAFETAQAASMTGAVLSQLFSRAIHAGKRARTETEISRFTTSVSYAGALMVLEHINAANPTILVIGAGEMAILAAKALHKHGITRIAFINRTYTRAEALANELGGTALKWHQLREALAQADAVITATGAPHLVIYADDVESILANRDGRPLCFVDIAVPRDVEVEVGQLPGVQRLDIDDLQSFVDTNATQRQAAVPAVEAVIEQEMDTFMAWYSSREVTPVIHNLRRWANDVAQAEVAQALHKLGEADPHTADVVNRLAHRIVNKLLHEPTVRLRGQAVEGNGHGYAQAVLELFGLRAAECSLKQTICVNDGSTMDQMSCNLQCIMNEGNNQPYYE